MLLTEEQAKQIAHSQKDLGGVSKNQMIRVLSQGAEFDLDDFSQFIVNTVQSGETLEEIQSSLNYYKEQLDAVIKTMNDKGFES
jgi:hypothetical protein